MKILLLTHAISRHKDDLTQFINELALAYQRAGHCVEVLTASHYSIDRKQLDSRLIFSFYRYAPRAMERLGYGETLQADLKMNLAGLFFAPLMLVCGTLSLRRKIKQFKPDIIHAHWALPNGLIAALATLGLDTKYMISFPGSDVTVMGANSLFKMLGRFTCRRAIALTTNSHDLRDAVVAYGVPKEKFHFVLYGSDSTFKSINAEFICDFKRKYHIQPDDKLILAVGRMVPKKGFRYLIEALPMVNQRLAANNSYKLILIGDGILKKPLQYMCSQLGLDHQVVFMGHVKFGQLPQYYLMADFLAMPAVREPADGLNVVVTEAMKYGIPIAATNVGGNELVVEDDVNGYLCHEKSAAAFADILVRLISNPERAVQMGQVGKKIFHEKASWNQIVVQYETIIENNA